MKHDDFDLLLHYDLLKQNAANNYSSWIVHARDVVLPLLKEINHRFMWFNVYCNCLLLPCGFSLMDIDILTLIIVQNFGL